MRRPRSTAPTRASRLIWATCVLVALAACSSDDPGTEVVLIGDSIAQETAPYLVDRLDDARVLERFLGGTAPCDWLNEELEAEPDRVMVVSFTGNSLTPCMADGAGGFLHGQALVDKYRTDLTALVGLVRSSGAPVVLVGQPPRGPTSAADGDLEVSGINGIYTELADAEGVTFVDAGAALETGDGAFAVTLPCLPAEPECGPDGANPVRNDDGVHLCPGTARLPCPVYSSGAFRFADAIAGAIEEL